MTTTTTSDALLAARDYIQDHGWTQQTFEAEDGSVCLSGALSRVGSCEAYNWLLDFCYRFYDDRGVIYTNDQILTSKQDAIDLLEDAAKDAANS